MPDMKIRARLNQVKIQSKFVSKSRLDKSEITLNMQEVSGWLLVIDVNDMWLFLLSQRHMCISATAFSYYYYHLFCTVSNLTCIQVLKVPQRAKKKKVTFLKFEVAWKREKNVSVKLICLFLVQNIISGPQRKKIIIKNVWNDPFKQWNFRL